MKCFLKHLSTTNVWLIDHKIDKCVNILQEKANVSCKWQQDKLSAAAFIAAVEHRFCHWTLLFERLNVLQAHTPAPFRMCYHWSYLRQNSCSVFWMKLPIHIWLLLPCVQCFWKILVQILVKMPGKKLLKEIQEIWIKINKKHEGWLKYI